MKHGLKRKALVTGRDLACFSNAGIVNYEVRNGEYLIIMSFKVNILLF